MRLLATLLLLLLGSSSANATQEAQYSSICTYQSSISTHIAYELLQGVEYQQAVRNSFELFMLTTPKEAIDVLEEALGVHFNKEQRHEFGVMLGLAGIVWASGFRDGWVIGTYEEFYDRSFITCMTGVEQTGVAGYFDVYYLSLMLYLEEKSTPKTKSISH